MKKEGGVVSREELIYNIEAISEETTNKSIDVIIGRIRQKLGENPKEPTYIHAVRGVGYKFLQ
jgi:two-component system OmpR family response regulator